MAFSLARFFQDRRGTTFEGVALSVSIIAVAFVASADMLDYFTKSHGDANKTVAAASAPSAAGNDLDLTPTATLPKLVSRSVLDPCTGQTK